MTSDVVCLGILVADVIARPVDEFPHVGSLRLVESISLRSGGCALNTATALTRLGLRAAVAGKLGVDPLGEFLLRLIDERGIDRRSVVCDADVPTSATIVLVTQEGERTFLHLTGASAHLRTDELDSALLYSGHTLHIAGALVMDALDGEPLAGILAEAKRRGVMTSLDTVWDSTDRWARILPCLPYVDLFAPSLAEARAITQEHDVESVARSLRRAGAREVVLKLGPDGCYVAGVGHVAPVPVRAIDGTGAGDAFTAGLLFGVLEQWPLDRAARLGNAAGALSTTAIGATEGLRGLNETLALAGLE